MFFSRIISNFRCPCSLLQFGNPSWADSPFGFPSDTAIPLINEKPADTLKKQAVSFEFEDKFKVI